MRLRLKNTILFSALLLSISAYTQEDTLSIKRFDHKDLATGLDKKKAINISANRLAEKPEDLAQEIIIIDGDDIRKFGYSTLTDVLKSIPGFRVSQPGNALEGETFLMRGLYGNDHAKILVNGIPIKPEAVRGMPIGAQLPIRHAERIEIVLGPSSASYGTDAMAGVINIVLPEIDRPVFAWADINLSSPKATDMNLTLGGKVGKGKNILNYELFASSYEATDLNILIPDDSIRVEPGELNSAELDLFYGQEGVPEIDDLKSASRLIGGYVKFRWFELSAISMYRQEHSGIGSHPLEQSYHDPGLSFGEKINSFALKYNDVGNKRFQSKAAISALYYRTLTNSTYYGTSNFLCNGKNFMYAKSLDIHAEYQGILKINTQMSVVAGASADYSISHPFSNYLGRPYREEGLSFDIKPDDMDYPTGIWQSAAIDSISMIDSTVFLETFEKNNFGGFLQLAYNSRSGKFNMQLGTRLDVNSFNETVFTPKVGFVYKPFKRLRFNAHYGRGYRTPRSYYIYNNYIQDALAYSQGEKLQREATNILSEHMHGGEAAVRWMPSRNWELSGTYFIHYMENKVMRQIYLPDSGAVTPNTRIGFGFFNGASHSTLNAFLIKINYLQQFGRLEISADMGYQYAYGWELVDLAEDAPDSVERSTGYRFVPDHSFTANFNISMFDFTLSFRHSVLGHYVSEIYRVNQHVDYQETERYFYNLDILLHKQLFRQLSVFGGVYNVFDTVQSGIPNVNLSNTWTFNPQYGRIFKVGLTFKLN